MISKRLLMAALITALFLLSHLVKGLVVEGDVRNNNGPTPCKRIVSMAPSITETLFVLGLGERVVGVTRYCDYPPEALNKEKIGGYYDPNYEAVYSLDPDLVIMLPEHGRSRKVVSSMGIDTLVVNNKTVEDILNSINTIGSVCSVEERAKEVVNNLRERLEAVKELTSGLPRPGVMVSLGRGMATDSIKNVYIAGRGGFYDELLELAGGVNVYKDDMIKFPVLSREGILALDPDVVLDLVPYVEEKGWSEADIKKEWKRLSTLRAVRYGRVYVLGSDYVTVPGPRFILLLEDMVRAIHPEAAGNG